MTVKHTRLIDALMQKKGYCAVRKLYSTIDTKKDAGYIQTVLKTDSRSIVYMHRNSKTEELGASCICMCRSHFV